MSSVSSGTPQEMLDIIKDYRAIGYRGHSVKVGGDVELDIARIRFLEENRVAAMSGFYTMLIGRGRGGEAVIVMNAVADLGGEF